MVNPYDLPLAEASVSHARLRVETLTDLRKYVDEQLKSAKLKLKHAEEDLIFTRQIRMFDDLP